MKRDADLLEIIWSLWHNKKGCKDTAVEGGKRDQRFDLAPKEQTEKVNLSGKRRPAGRTSGESLL